MQASRRGFNIYRDVARSEQWMKVSLSFVARDVLPLLNVVSSRSLRSNREKLGVPKSRELLL